MFRKDSAHKLVMLTCYDFPTARALDTSDIDIVLVGDSLGTNMLGYESELEVTLADMLHHCRAVRKGITVKPLVVDLSYATYATVDQALASSRALRDAGAEAVKMEGGAQIGAIVRAVVADGIPVMGHIGFTPQLAGTNRRTVVGAQTAEAVRLFHDAVALQDAGVCAIVLECVPEMVAKEITERLTIPTIGIGSGKYVDGQVLVYTDIVGWFDLHYRFVKHYDSFFTRTVEAAARFSADVRSEAYPQREEGFRIKKEELEAFRNAIRRT